MAKLTCSYDNYCSSSNTFQSLILERGQLTMTCCTAAPSVHSFVVFYDLLDEHISVHDKECSWMHFRNSNIIQDGTLWFIPVFQAGGQPREEPTDSDSLSHRFKFLLL